MRRRAAPDARSDRTLDHRDRVAAAALMKRKHLNRVSADERSSCARDRRCCLPHGKIAALVRNTSHRATSATAATTGQGGSRRPAKPSTRPIPSRNGNITQGVKSMCRWSRIASTWQSPGDQLIVEYAHASVLAQQLGTARCVARPEGAEGDSRNRPDRRRWSHAGADLATPIKRSQKTRGRSGICSRFTGAGRVSVVLSTLTIVTDGGASERCRPGGPQPQQPDLSANHSAADGLALCAADAGVGDERARGAIT